jgi:hypothetical protein
MPESLTISPRMYIPETLQRCKLHECHGACCAFGVWIDLLEKERIINFAEIVQSCMDPTNYDHGDWFLSEIEMDSFTLSGKVVHSRLVSRNLPFKRKTCIFLRTDHKCALQVASEQLGKHPWFLKPFYCVLHPLDLNDNGQVTLDHTKIILQEEKSCLRYSERLNSPIEIFEGELRFLLGDSKYLDSLRLAEQNWKLESNQEKE